LARLWRVRAAHSWLFGRNSYPVNWNVVRFESRDDDDFTELEKLVAEVSREFHNRFEVKTAARYGPRQACSMLNKAAAAVTLE
jgi:hypothetical protein